MRIALAFSGVSLLMLGLVIDLSTAQDSNDEIEFHRDNYSLWKQYLLPTEAELSFYKIPWERTFQDGIMRGDRVGKPILLWAMNGHPLGCT